MTSCFCCAWKKYGRNHLSAVGPLLYPDHFSKCRLEYINNKRFLNVLHIKPSVNFNDRVKLEESFSLPSEANGHFKYREESGAKICVSSKPPVVHKVDNPDESDNEEVDVANRHVVVKVDLERPKTNETMSSMLSLPPLSARSPDPSGITMARRQLKKLKSLLPKRQMSSVIMVDNNNAQQDASVSSNVEPQVPVRQKRLSVVFALKSRKKQPAKQTQHEKKPNVDEIIQTCPEPETKSSPETRRNVSTVTFTGISNVRNSKLDPSQFVMFFIHGVGGCLKVWQSQIAYFYDKGFELVAIDLIGHGSSSLPKKSPDYNFDAIKTDVITIFDKYSKQRNIVVAHSYGTCFAAVLSRERPTKVSHLVFLSSGAPVPLDPEDGPFKLPSPILSLFRPVLNDTFRNRKCFTILERLPSGTQRMPPLAFCKTPSPETFKRAFGIRTWVLKRIMQGQHWPTGNLLYHQQISVPTLLLYGNLDGLVTLDEMNQMRKAIADSHLEVIDNASHMIMQESGDNVNELIEKFLQLCPTADTGGTSSGGGEPVEEGYVNRRVKSAGTVSRSLPPTKAFRLQSARRR